MFERAATPPFYCNICRKDISFEPRIKCLSCKNFDLCLDCFRVGAEIFPHEATHPYIVCPCSLFFTLHSSKHCNAPQQHPLATFNRSLRSSTFRSSSPTGLPLRRSFFWTPLPHLVLATGKQLFAVHVCVCPHPALSHTKTPPQAQNLGSKTADECRDHYYEVYFGSKCAPLPDPLDIIPGSPHTLQEMHAQAIATKPRLSPFLSPSGNPAQKTVTCPQANGARG